MRALLTCCGLGAGACAIDDPDELGTWVSSINLDDFVLPSLTAAERAPIVRKYDLLDPDDVIPRGLFEDAIVYFDVNKAQIPTTRYLAIADLSLYSGMDRFWLVDTTTGSVEPHKVAHGDGSDPDNDGYATLFGNVEGSHMSSLGFYLAGEIYDGTHPHSMRLDGLSVDGSPNGMANTNARDRLIVMHEASYVNDDNTSQQGRSNGCLVLDSDIEAGVVDRLHDGSLIYSGTKQLAMPVGRAACGDATCDGDETEISCAQDCTVRSGSGSDVPPDEEAPSAEVGGCSTSGSGASALFAVALGGLGGRRRRRARA